MSKSSAYLTAFKAQMEDLANKQGPDIIKMAEMIGQVMLNDGIIQLFGWDGDQTLSMELGFRAGGLIQYHRLDPKELVLRQIISNEEFNDPKFLTDASTAENLLALYQIEASDAFLLTQISHPNALVDNLAKLAKKHQQKVFLITNTNFPGNQISTAYQLADAIVDLAIPYPDNVLTLAGDLKTGATANLLGNIVAQMLTAEIYHYLVENNAKPGILISMNVKGADEHNRELGLKYDGRYNS